MGVFRMMGEIGRGSFATVYKAVHTVRIRHALFFNTSFSFILLLQAVRARSFCFLIPLISCSASALSSTLDNAG